MQYHTWNFEILFPLYFRNCGFPAWEDFPWQVKVMGLELKLNDTNIMPAGIAHASLNKPELHDTKTITVLYISNNIMSYC